MIAIDLFGSPRPWRVEKEKWDEGSSVRIVDAKGNAVADLYDYAASVSPYENDLENAKIIVAAVNRLG